MLLNNEENHLLISLVEEEGKQNSTQKSFSANIHGYGYTDMKIF